MHIAHPDTLLRPDEMRAPRLMPDAPAKPAGPRFVIRWNGPRWAEVDQLTGEIIAEGVIDSPRGLA